MQIVKFLRILNYSDKNVIINVNFGCESYQKNSLEISEGSGLASVGTVE